MGNKNSENYFLSGFWKRLLAFAFDYFFLSFICSIIISLFFDELIPYGESLWWIGFAIGGLYFIFFFGKGGKGQTFGMRLFNITVLSSSGEYLDKTSSVLRYIIVSAALFYPQMIQLFFPQTSFNLLYVVYTYFFVFCFIVAMIIFSAFDPKRRGLHDLMSGSLVFNFFDINSTGKTEILKKVKELKISIASIVLYLIIVSFAGFSFYAAIKVPGLDKINYGNFYEVKQVLESKESLSNVQIMPVFVYENNSFFRIIIINAYMGMESIDNKDTIADIKNVVLQICTEKIENILQYKYITLNLKSGVDLGLSEQRVVKFEKIILNDKAQELKIN